MAGDRAFTRHLKLAIAYPITTASAALEVAGTVPPPDKPPVDPNQKVTRVTYVYEKDQNLPPLPVESALQKLNQQGILASSFEDDTVDGTGQVPDQYKVALAEAKKQGVPVLIVETEAGVKWVVKAPKTEAEVLEAAQ